MSSNLYDDVLKDWLLSTAPWMYYVSIPDARISTMRIGRVFLVATQSGIDIRSDNNYKINHTLWADPDCYKKLDARLREIFNLPQR